MDTWMYLRICIGRASVICLDWFGSRAWQEVQTDSWVSTNDGMMILGTVRIRRWLFELWCISKSDGVCGCWGMIIWCGFTSDLGEKRVCCVHVFAYVCRWQAERAAARAWFWLFNCVMLWGIGPTGLRPMVVADGLLLSHPVDSLANVDGWRSTDFKRFFPGVLLEGSKNRQ